MGGCGLDFAGDHDLERLAHDIDRVHLPVAPADLEMQMGPG